MRNPAAAILLILAATLPAGGVPDTPAGAAKDAFGDAGNRDTRSFPGKVFRDCPDCPEMVVIPAGSFRMGCLSNDDDCFEDEFPVHEVTIWSFALSKYEVTSNQWDACVAAGGCGGYRPESLRSRIRPVVDVSWEDAQSFVAWLSDSTGYAYRLPTEAEWEYAARAGSVTKYHFGNDESQLCRYANHADRDTRYEWRNTACSDHSGDGLMRVGFYEPNEFGLYDMHGNVWELVEDCWNESYTDAPSNGSAWLTGRCGSRVKRGGAYYSPPRDVRSALRSSSSSDFRVFNVGFRVARTLTP